MSNFQETMPQLFLLEDSDMSLYSPEKLAEIALSAIVRTEYLRKVALERTMPAKQIVGEAKYNRDIIERIQEEDRNRRLRLN
jgi:hypothetical protein